MEQAIPVESTSVAGRQTTRYEVSPVKGAPMQIAVIGAGGVGGYHGALAGMSPIRVNFELDYVSISMGEPVLHIEKISREEDCEINEQSPHKP